MDARSRTFLIAAGAVLGLAVLGSVVYILNKRSVTIDNDDLITTQRIHKFEEIGGRNQTIVREEYIVNDDPSENNKTTETEQTTDQTNEPANQEEVLMAKKTQEALQSYNPLQMDYKRVTDWSEFAAEGETLTGAAADFHNVGDCRRVVVFLSEGVVLGHVRTDCDALEPAMGLVMVEGGLFYYGTAMVQKTSLKDVFVVYEKVPGERNCVKDLYNVDITSQLDSTYTKKIVEEDEDIGCRQLVNFEMPKMMLLSGHGNLGFFSEGIYWATVNPWEALGVATKIYWYGPRCFRLMVITSYGRSVQAVKVSCGNVQNMVFTSDAIFFGDAFVMTTNDKQDNFVLTYNLKRRGECIQKHIYMPNKGGRPEATVKSKKTLDREDPDCQSLIRGDVAGASVSDEVLNELHEKLELGSFGVEPYEDSMSNYKPWSHFNSFNLSMKLGLAVRFYKHQQDRSTHKLVLAVAKGVPLASTFLPFGPVHRLVLRDDVLYYNTTLMLRASQEDNTFTTLIKVDSDNCLKQAFLLKIENSEYVKQELPSGGKVAKSSDADCNDLLEGNQLQSAEYKTLNYDTDEIGVPKYLPPEVNTSENN